MQRTFPSKSSFTAQDYGVLNAFYMHLYTFMLTEIMLNEFAHPREHTFITVVTRTTTENPVYFVSSKQIKNGSKD